MPKKTNMRLPRDVTTKRANRQVKRAAKSLPKLTTKEIIAAKLGCEPDELLAYVEKPNSLIIAIAPDGRKFKFTKGARSCLACRQAGEDIVPLQVP